MIESMTLIIQHWSALPRSLQHNQPLQDYDSEND